MPYVNKEISFDWDEIAELYNDLDSGDQDRFKEETGLDGVSEDAKYRVFEDYLSDAKTDGSYGDIDDTDRERMIEHCVRAESSEHWITHIVTYHGSIDWQEIIGEMDEEERDRLGDAMVGYNPSIATAAKPRVTVSLACSTV